MNCCYSQEKEKLKVARAEKVASRIKKKAVKQHENFKAAVNILRQHRMEAKKGRRLLKIHYVALIEDADGIKDAGMYLSSIHYHHHRTTTPPYHHHNQPTNRPHPPEKKKVSTLKNMFWSRPEVYGKYMNHADITSESSDDEEDADEKVSDNEEDTDDQVKRMPTMMRMPTTRTATMTIATT